MKILWEDPKRLKNLEIHRLDFADLDLEFFDASLVGPSKFERLKAVGVFGDTVIAVVFRPLGREAISVISMRPASRKERKLMQ